VKSLLAIYHGRIAYPSHGGIRSPGGCVRVYARACWFHRIRENRMKRVPIAGADRSSASRISFRLQIRAVVGRQFVQFLRTRLRAARELIDAPLRELSLALVNDARMSQLHQTYMNLTGPTDVLTFPLDQDARGRALAGEVVVCVPEARRQARRTRHARRGRAAALRAARHVALGRLRR
jgi:hypothetical protein